MKWNYEVELRDVAELERSVRRERATSGVLIVVGVLIVACVCLASVLN